VYLEAKFRSLRQGDMSITDYTARLKTLANSLRDLSQAVSQPSQVLNLIWGLHPRYRHLKPVITSKSPPYTFMSARSYLLLEELCDKHEASAESGQAYHASHGSNSGTANTDNSGSGNSCNKPRYKKRRSGSGSNNNRGYRGD
jgi:hypothetical protein